MFDYSDLARPLTSEQMGGRCDVAILVDRDGAGMCIAANRLSGLRAAVAGDEFTAAYVRKRYHCNVLCLGADQHGPGELIRIVASFLAAVTSADANARLTADQVDGDGSEQTRLSQMNGLI